MRWAVFGIGGSAVIGGLAWALFNRPEYGWIMVVAGAIMLFVAAKMRDPDPKPVRLALPDPVVIAVLTQDRLGDWGANVAPFGVKNIGETAARDVSIRALRVHGYTFEFERINVLDPGPEPTRIRYQTTHLGGAPTIKGFDMDDTFGVNWFSAALRGVVKEHGKPINIHVRVDYVAPAGVPLSHEMAFSCEVDGRLRTVSA